MAEEPNKPKGLLQTVLDITWDVLVVLASLAVLGTLFLLTAGFADLHRRVRELESRLPPTIEYHIQELPPRPRVPNPNESFEDALKRLRDEHMRRTI